MASSLEKFAALYGKPEQPASAAPTILGNLTERVAGTYAHCPAAPQRSPTNAPRLTAEQQRAVRDAMHDRTTLTQRMTAMLSGPSSYTIPASFQLSEYRPKIDEMGIDRVVAPKVLDGLLSEDPGGIGTDAKIGDVVRARAQAIGIDPDAAQRCVAAFLTLGDEPGK